MFEANASSYTLEVKNEISYQNLISIANNPILFKALDDGTQQLLIDTIRTYTVACLEQINKDWHFKQANERMKNK